MFALNAEQTSGFIQYTPPSQGRHEVCPYYNQNVNTGVIFLITDLKTALQSMKAVAAVTYKEWAAFRSHTMISIFVGPVFYLVQMYIWTAVYAGNDGERINGMSLRDNLASVRSSAPTGMPYKPNI